VKNFNLLGYHLLKINALKAKIVTRVTSFWLLLFLLSASSLRAKYTGFSIGSAVYPNAIHITSEKY